MDVIIAKDLEIQVLEKIQNVSVYVQPIMKSAFNKPLVKWKRARLGSWEYIQFLDTEINKVSKGISQGIITER